MFESVFEMKSSWVSLFHLLFEWASEMVFVLELDLLWESVTKFLKAFEWKLELEMLSKLNYQKVKLNLIGTLMNCWMGLYFV